ncbi:MAG TPA: ABC transporter permease [Casimicrobiaceae bacterium]|nr:ABC transporter permease [Casimicrobiaceae bacterium]
MTRPRRRRILSAAAKRSLPFLIAAIVIVVVWQLVVTLTHPDPSVLPTPWATAIAFIGLVRNGQLGLDALYSVARVVSAWLLSAIVAIPLGLLMGSSLRLERIVNPFVELLRPISPLAWIPMAILWFGIGEGGKVFVVFVGTFFPILLSTVAGVKAVDPVLLNAGRVFGCTSRLALFRRVVVPASLPSVVVGLRVAFGTGWAAIIAAELVAAHTGLGYLIANGMDILRADLVLVGMAAIGLLGFLFDAFFRALQRQFGGSS